MHCYTTMHTYMWAQSNTSIDYRNHDFCRFLSYKVLRRSYREPTKMMVLVAEGRVNHRISSRIRAPFFPERARRCSLRLHLAKQGCDSESVESLVGGPQDHVNINIRNTNHGLWNPSSLSWALGLKWRVVMCRWSLGPQSVHRH